MKALSSQNKNRSTFHSSQKEFKMAGGGIPFSLVVYMGAKSPFELNLGWGRTVGGGNASDTLQQGMLPVQSHAKCSAFNNSMFEVDETSMICGGSGKPNQAGGCQGDSGGPYVCKEQGKLVLRGVVSWGDPVCNTEHFSVFTRVSSFRNWIDKKLSRGKVSFVVVIVCLFVCFFKFTYEITTCCKMLLFLQK